jgi:peptidyl-tRNA hydrolase
MPAQGVEPSPCEGGGKNAQKSEETVDEEFTDAEIRTLLKKVASDRRRDEMRKRLERAGDPREKTSDEGATETPSETPLEQKPAA